MDNAEIKIEIVEKEVEDVVKEKGVEVEKSRSSKNRNFTRRENSIIRRYKYYKAKYQRYRRTRYRYRYYRMYAYYKRKYDDIMKKAQTNAVSTKPQPQAKPQKVALLIGINYRGSNAELSGCINDVQDIRKMLINEYGYKSKNIIMLTDDTAKKPTKRNINNALRDLVARSKSGYNQMWLHYSGHGSYSYDRNSDEKDGKDETLVPIDYQTSGVISDDYLYSNFIRQLSPSCNLTAIMDCCHSGTVLDLPFIYQNGGNVLENPRNRNTPSNITMISGCKDDQTSADAWISGTWNGAMSWSLLQAIRICKSDAPVVKIIAKMRELLKISQYSQYPQLTSSKRLNVNTKLHS
jgi:hypothetical protein